MLLKLLSRVPRQCINSNNFLAVKLNYNKIIYSLRSISLVKRGKWSNCSVHSGSGNDFSFLVHAVAVSVGRHTQQNISDRVGRKTYGTVLKENPLNMVEKKPFQRLPTTVKPKHYTLTLTPDLKALTFKGEVTIHIEVCITALLFVEYV